MMNAQINTRQGGFSMVEILIAMLLGLFLVAALVQILIEGKQSFASANHLSRLQENGRIATSMIVTDLKRAGYMGGNSDVPNIYGTEDQIRTTVSGGDPYSTCPANSTEWGRMIQRRVVGLDDTSAGYDCIDGASYLRGDILAVRYASPWIVDDFEDGRLYLRSNLFEGKIFSGDNENDAQNQMSDPIGMTEHDLLAYAYYVGDSTRTCSGRVVPSLFRVRLDDNGQPLAEELLPGIEHFQVQYGDGQRYYDANNVADWDDVVTARIWLLVRSECPEGDYADGRTYTLGNQVYTPNDNYRRQLYSSVVMLRNTL